MAHDLKDATVYFEDGGKTELAFRIANGSLKDISIDGKLSEITMDFIWKFVRSTSSNLTLVEFLRNDNGKFISSDEDCSSAYAVRLTFRIEKAAGCYVVLRYRNFRYLSISSGPGEQVVHLEGQAAFESAITVG